MNKALDPKDLVNPFVVPSPLSLLDVFNSIRETELPTARKRDLLSALRRVQRFTGTPLALIPADLAQLRDRLARVQPAHHGVSAKTWANIRSSLFTAIVISGVTPVLRTARMQYSSAWCALLTSSDKRTHYGLTRFAKFCSSNGIEPQAVDDEAVEAFRRALHNSSLHPKTKTIARDTATLWNRLREKPAPDSHACVRPQSPQAVDAGLMERVAGELPSGCRTPPCLGRRFRSVRRRRSG